MKKRVTIGDVAEAAGVSKQTVSRAVNDRADINASTKERVLRIARELGYRPNRLARAINSQRTHMIGLIVPDITNPFFPEVARGAQDRAMAQDCTVIIVNTDETAAQEMRMLELMAEHSVDGIISFTHQITDEALVNFADDYRPIIMINRAIEHPNITCLLVDNGKGAELAVTHLAEQGHRHIAMLSNATFAPGHIRRVQGYLRALTQHQLPDYLYSTHASSKGGHTATLSLLTAHPDITAIFCYNDMMAIGALQACQEVGKRVPEDIAIVGFDDIRLVSSMAPSISSVHVDKYEIGRIAVERIFDLLESEAEITEPIRIEPSLVIRDSSRH